MAARSARSWNFSKYFWLFQWEKIIFCQNAYFCLKMIFRPCYFYFFSILSKWGGWVLESMENSILFLRLPLDRLSQFVKLDQSVRLYQSVKPISSVKVKQSVKLIQLNFDIWLWFQSVRQSLSLPVWRSDCTYKAWL